MKRLLIILFPMFLSGCGLLGINDVTSSLETANLEGEVVRNVSLQIDSNSAKIPLEELLDGCPFKDCIPSIDEPQFESVSKADSWLNPSDRIFIFTLNGVTRLYPQKILNWHEVVNDWYPSDDGQSETAIAVTFCPLCGTATAFERKVHGTVTEFGVSGKLHNSDLVMYDRLEGSLWQQVTGEAIVGPAAERDEVLEPMFVITLDWSQVKEQFPEAEVLSRNTGFTKDYDRYPYGSYEEDGRILFPAGAGDQRLHPKVWVYGIQVDGHTKAYVEDSLLAQKEILDEVGGISVSVQNDAGVITFSDTETGEEIVPLRSFWFAWAAFNPDTGLYQ